MERITSKDNNRIKKLKALLAKSKERTASDTFVAEGLRLVMDTPEELIRELYIAEDLMDTDIAVLEFADRLVKRGTSVWTVTNEVMKQISDTVTPQGFLAVVSMPSHDREDIFGKDGEKPLILILEDVRDPGNMGTIIRTAEGAGVTGLIMTKGCVDVFSPKVVRSTMGSIFRVPMWEGAELREAVSLLKERGCRIFGAHLNGADVYDGFNYIESTAFLIGNEANGMSNEARILCDDLVIIPMKGKLESLNASVAAGILAYEAARQRR